MADHIFERLKCELFPTATLVDLRGWGESTMLRNLSEKIAETVATGPRLRLVTNGLAISKSLWHSLMISGSSVVVSVDASTAETMTALGRGSLSKLKLSLLAGALERDACNAGGVISFNSVVTSLNLHELPDIVRLADEYQVKRLTIFPVVAARTNPLHLEHRKGEIQHFVDSAEAVARSLGIELRIGASLHEESVVTEGLPDRCSHPWEYCYIDYAGNVGYCDHLIGNTALTIGNLGDASFESIWNGPQMQRLRDLHVRARRKQPGELDSEYSHCAWCYRRRYVDFEDETNVEAISRTVSTFGNNPLLRASQPPFVLSEFMSARKLPFRPTT